MRNLLKNPAKGGMPPSENTANIMMQLKTGLVLYKPLKAAIEVFPPEAFSTAEITPNTAKFENT